MNQTHYIIFHPEHSRKTIEAGATVIEKGIMNNSWKGKIYVDKMGNGNEDPFVFSDPWLYSYCHATQLRRTPREDGSYLQKDSVIFFVSGDCVNKEHLTIDTVFVIENALRWTKKPKLALPIKFRGINESTPLWNRHLRFPFCGQHDSVTHTYEARHYTNQETKVEAHSPIKGVPNSRIASSQEAFAERNCNIIHYASRTNSSIVNTFRDLINQDYKITWVANTHNIDFSMEQQVELKELSTNHFVGIIKHLIAQN